MQSAHTQKQELNHSLLPGSVLTTYLLKVISDFVFLTDEYKPEMNKPDLLQATSQQNSPCKT